MSAPPPTPWSHHSKHIFIVTSAGKPVWSRWGDAGALSSLAPVVQAVLAFAEDSGEPLTRLTLSDGSLFLVSTRGHLHCCALSRTGETVHSLTQQLRAVWSYLLFSTLPNGSLQGRLNSRPGLDIRPFCTGITPGLYALIKSSSYTPSVWLDAYPMAPMNPLLRAKACSVLSSGGCEIEGLEDSCSGRLLYSILLAGDSLVAWTQLNKGSSGDDLSLRPSDLQCMLAFICASREALFIDGSDAWVSFGLPGVSANGGTVQAFMSRLWESADKGRKPAPPSNSTCATTSAKQNGMNTFSSPLHVFEGPHGSLTNEKEYCENKNNSEVASRPGTFHEPSRIFPPPPSVTLILVVAEGSTTRLLDDNSGEGNTLTNAIASRATTIVRGLAESGVSAAAAKAVCVERGNLSLWESAIAPLHSLLSLPPPLPPSPFSPCLLHWVYCWKSARQWSLCPSWPPGFILDESSRKVSLCHTKRKALLRTYSALYSTVCFSPCRHATSSFSWASLPHDDVNEKGLEASFIQCVAALNTTNAIIFAAWGTLEDSISARGVNSEQQLLPTDRIPGLMEKLAKALKIQNERLFLLPGPPSL